jgi:GDPmannose 4,6-dehydratase
MAAARIAQGSKETLYLGNLDAIRDWGYAKEYVESMWLMLQNDEPSDYVIATGVGATVRDFCEVTFRQVGLNWENHVNVDERYMRPTEVNALIGNPHKANTQLGWRAKTHWEDLAILMVAAEMERS